MKSFCIKTNNQKIIEYLLKSLESISDMEDIYFVHRKFKLYHNMIIHYKGENSNAFYVRMSDLLADTVLFFYEPLLIRENIRFNYFYFEEYEKKCIEENCYQFICSNSLSEETTLPENRNNRIVFRKEEISSEFLFYLLEHRSLILDGFVHFRLANYLKTLDEIVEYAVNEYVVEKEYSEFIHLLQIYIDSKEAQTDLVHLIYTNGESILLDEEKNLISLNDHIFDAKYLSDISFSSNDYALNSLLTLLPDKIEIHLIGFEDDFITTLKLIFGTRITICKECNLCRTYRILNNAQL